MIIGLKKWDDANTYYKQDNNSTEQLLKKDGKRDSEKIIKICNQNNIGKKVQEEIIKSIKGFLETCGPTAAINILAARGNNVKIPGPGIYEIQPEDYLTAYFNDPRNYDKLKNIRDLNNDYYFGNEIPQFYPLAISECFNVETRFDWGVDYNTLKMYLSSNVGVMLCLKNPGHFIAVVAMNDETNEIIYRDPWPGNYWPYKYKGTSGFNRVLKYVELAKNIQNYSVIIGVTK